MSADRDPAPAGASSPHLSVIVLIVSDTSAAESDTFHLAGCLESLANQVGAPPFEVIVPHHTATHGIDALRDRFPAVRFVAVPDLRTFARAGTGSREHHDELRAHGLARARGSIIGFLEDHAHADPHWCARAVAAHGRGYAVVGGAIENGVDRLLNWAVYFCDFARYQNPVGGETQYASDANVTYSRESLERVRAEWRETFHETAVNRALMAGGEKMMLAGDLVVFQHRHRLTLGRALEERFVWGRSYAAGRSRLAGNRRFVYALLSPALPFVLLLRMTATVWRKRRNRGPFLKALPLIALLTASWSCGELAGYLTARATAEPR